jgi:hypothetical protein
MGKHSKKTISSAGQGSEPERSGLGADRDNPEQRPLVEIDIGGETQTSVDSSQYETIDTYHKGFQRGYRLGYKQMKDFYEAKIVVLEKQVAYWKEIAKR